MTSKKYSASSRRWLKAHFSDKYVQQARKQGIRSRAWFKLAEIQKKDKLFQQGMTIIDLGAAPGGWSQYVAAQIVGKGRIIASDILPMDPIVGVDFIQGDVRHPLILQSLIEYIGKKKAQVVLSDMAPNMSGNPEVDIPRSIYLVEIALEMCRDMLEPGGNFLVKVFQGEGFDEYLRKIISRFTKVKIRKPNTSLARSREVYIVATGCKI